MHVLKFKIQDYDGHSYEVNENVQIFQKCVNVIAKIELILFNKNYSL